MASNLIDLYEFLKDPTNIGLQNKVRGIDFEEVHPQVYTEYERLCGKDGWYKTVKDNYHAFIAKIRFNGNTLSLSKTVTLLLRIVDSTDEVSPTEVYDPMSLESTTQDPLSFVAELGFIGGVEAFLKTSVNDVTWLEHVLNLAVIYNHIALLRVLLEKDLANKLLENKWSGCPIINALSTAVKMGYVEILADFDAFLTEKQFELTPEDRERLLSAAYCNGQIESAEALLKRALTPEEAGEALVRGLKPDYPRGLDVAKLLTKNPPQKKIDKAFDTEIKKTINAGRTKEEEGKQTQTPKSAAYKYKVTLSSAAKVLLEKISSEQVDKTLKDVIDWGNFDFVEDILNRASSAEALALIDDAFDSEVKKTIEAGRGRGEKESNLSPAAKVLLEKISSAQVDKTLKALIDGANFDFVGDILKKASSQQITHFFIQLMEKGYKASLCIKWFSAQRSRLTPEQKEEIYRVAQKTAALAVMEHIKPLSQKNTGESLVAVMENTEIDQRDAVQNLLQVENNKPSPEFIDKALVAAAKDGKFDIVEILRKEATPTGINAGLVAAAEHGHYATVKILRDNATQEYINIALEGAFNLPSDSEQKHRIKISTVTLLLVGQNNADPYNMRWVCTRDTEKLSNAINTLRRVAATDPAIKKICDDLSWAERALQIGCQLQDVQTYLSAMNTESEIAAAKSRYPTNMTSIQNALTMLLSFVSCIFVITIPSVRKIWRDNLAQRGSSFLFFDKAEKQALEVVDNKLNDFLQKR